MHPSANILPWLISHHKSGLEHDQCDFIQNKTSTTTTLKNCREFDQECED